MIYDKHRYYLNAFLQGCGSVFTFHNFRFSTIRDLIPVSESHWEEIGDDINTIIKRYDHEQKQQENTA